MQRTAVIYGLAASTLVGALLLAPRIKPTPPEPPEPTPQPTPVSTAPITELVYSDGTLQVTARLDRGYLNDASGEPVWMDLAIKANGLQTHAPLTAVLVVDRSGSMAGDKIEAARMAAERFVNGMRDGDQLGIISFGTDVLVEFPLATMDTASRSRALGVVRRLEEGGGTNIDGGMIAARSMIKGANLAGRVGRVVLVSDGRPTEGDRRESVLVAHSNNLREAAVTTSTIGLGLDYNEDLMEHMAVEGGGRYHYLRHGDQMAKILDDELKHGAAVVAAGTKVFLPAGLNVIDVPGARFTRGERIAVDVGDLAAGEERHVLVKLAGAPTLSSSGDTVAFGAPELTYVTAGSMSPALLSHRADAFRMIKTTDLAQLDASRRDDVRVRVLQVEAALALTESMQAYNRGDRDTARRIVADKKVEIRAIAAKAKSPELAAEAANFDTVEKRFDLAPSSAEGQDMIKEQKARAFTLRR